ncbi:MAG: glycosyltransferase family 2 protein [Myxococcales bacterium]|nr:glycosyltransferase family 2 protein [Myxococcales bacterium]
MNSPVVSVIIPAYNEELYITEAIQSMLAQSYRELDIVVVDDGSSDRTPELLTALAGQEQRIRVVHQDNQGIVGALNRALAEAHGDYIARMDANDVCPTQRIARQMNYLHDFPEVALVSAWMASTTPKGHFQGSIWRTPALPGEVAWALHFGNAVVHAAFLARREAIDAVGGYRQEGVEHLEDYDLMLRLVGQWVIANLPEVLYFRRELPTGITRRQATTQAAGVKRRMADSLSQRMGETIDSPLVDALFRLHRGLSVPSDMAEMVRHCLVQLHERFLIDVPLTPLERERVDFDVARKLTHLAKRAFKEQQIRQGLGLLRQALLTSPIELPIRVAQRAFRGTQR